jgi:penicillin-binding protein 1C
MLPAAAAVSVILVAAGVAAAWIGSLGPAPLGERLEFSTVVVDRDGRLLRPYATTQGRWRLPVRADGVDPVSRIADRTNKRFRERRRRPRALMRATARVFAHGIVSGGSTLTMQVARLRAARRR